MSETTTSQSTKPNWRRVVAKYERPSLARSLGQLANTVISYFALLVAMYYTLNISYWITLALAIPAAGFLARIFIIFHDCGHGSFFKSKRANRALGFFTGLMTFIPSYYWSHEHAVHHSSAGDLDNRGSGDVWTLTVQEYLELPWYTRMRYRIYRNPFVLFGIGPVFTFFVRYRYWRRTDSSRARWSTIKTNLALVGIIVAASLTIGIKAYLMIQIPIMLIASTVGVWLFYVQHQFEGTYWERHPQWSYVREALEGSSFYSLPPILQWFTGNIGFHHVHHLSPRIPNYYLQRCHESSSMFRRVKRVTLLSSLKSLTYRLWDEERKHLVGFSYIPVFLKQQRLGRESSPRLD
ncbi:MAG: fatty acid desaturase [Candidatus Krumholzibacteria bacterium]|nr:fatty acid desaturase [Candidatus Krumholzibacteria bacterium]